MWNRLGIELSNGVHAAHLMAQVHPDAGLREQAEGHVVESEKFRTDLMLDSEVYAALVAVDRSTLDDGGTRVLDKALRDFRRAGVDRDDDDPRPAPRAQRAAAPSSCQDFARNIRDGRPVRSGSPADRARRACPRTTSTAHPAGEDGVVTITTDYPDIVPFLTFAPTPRPGASWRPAFLNRGLARQRRGAARAARRCAPSTATLLGYADWPAYDAEVKMIGTGHGDRRVHRPDRRGGRAGAERDLERAAGAQPRQDDPSVEAIDMATTGATTPSWSGASSTSVDAQQVRALLRLRQVRQGLLDVTGRLFGLALRARCRRAGAGTPTSRPTTCACGGEPLGPHPPRHAPARGQVQARGAVRPASRACAARSSPRACWSATSRAG